MPKGRGEPKEEPLGNKYLIQAPSKAELIRRLTQVADHLTTLSQDDRPRGLGDTAAVLISPQIMEQGDKEVRLLIACCLADILRIYAPEAPYDSKTLLRIFGLITAQLRGLSNLRKGESGKRILYLLQSIATVKSCIILSELTQQGFPMAEEQLRDLFDCFLTSIRPDHNSEIQSQMLEILAACMEELEIVPQSLLDTLLMSLTPHSKDDNLRSYQLAHVFLKRCFAKLQQPISLFLNTALTRQGGEVSEVEEYIFPLIYELHKVNPGIMLYVFPNVSTQLQAEDSDVRSTATALLGRLFASQHADYGREYPKIFREFLGRFKDKESKIRQQMISIGVVILQRKPHLAEAVISELKQRLHDLDAEVRGKIVKDFCEVAVQSISLVPEDAMRELGERVKDKKPNIREATMTGLAKIFTTYVSSRWLSGDMEEPLAPDVRAKVQWIPGLLLQCYAYPDADTKLLILQRFDEVILPASAPSLCRSSGLLSIFSYLQPAEKAAFKKILADRNRCQKMLAKYLKLRAEYRENLEDERLEISVDEALHDLLDSCSFSERKRGLAEKIAEHKDQKIFRYLKSIADPTTSFSELNKATDEIAQRLGSKSQAGAFARSLSRRCGLFFCNKEMITEFVAIASEELEAAELPQNVNSVMEVLDLVVDLFPSIMCDMLDSVLHLFWESSDDQEMQTRILRVLAKATMSPGSDRTHKESLKRFKEDVRKICARDGAPKQCKMALVALDKLIGEKDHVMASILQDLCKPTLLSSSCRRIEAVLKSLAVFAQRMPESFMAHAEKVQEVAYEVLQGKGNHEDEKGRKAKKGALARVTAAIKLLVGHLVPLRIRGEEDSVMHLEKESKNGMDLDEVIVSEEYMISWAGRLLDMLYQFLDDEGPRNLHLTGAEKARLRLVAASGVLKLMRNSYIQQKLLSTDRWYKLAWVMLDHDSDVRVAFMRKLARAVTGRKLPLKIMAILGLAAVDHEAVKREARTALMVAMRALRKGYESYLSSMQEEPSEEIMTKVATTMMPEYVLPYMLHLLAHYPDYPLSGDDKLRFKQLEKYLDFILEPLMKSLGVEADNIAFLLRMVDHITSSYTDATDPQSDNLLSVTMLCRDIIKLKIRTQENLTPYPGKIYLPTALYAPRRAKTRVKTEEAKDRIIEDKENMPNWGSPILQKQGTPSKLRSSLSNAAANVFASHAKRQEEPHLSSPSTSQLTSESRRKSSVSSGSGSYSLELDSDASQDDLQRQAAARALVEAQKDQRAARAAERAARQTNGQKPSAPVPARPYVKRASENKRKSMKELSPLEEGEENSPADSEESEPKKAKKVERKGGIGEALQRAQVSPASELQNKMRTRLRSMRH